MKKTVLDVSVIITTKNEESNIATCLKSIESQTYPQDKSEIIIVDNNSTDKTKEIARRYAGQVYNFGPNRAAQLNFGAKKAIGKFILYLDADMILDKNVIEECLNSCEGGSRVALYIPERIVGQNFFSKIRDFERSFYNATCVDAVRFVKKDKFLEVRGFDENLLFGSDDWDFDRRIRESGEVGIIAAPLYHNGKVSGLKGYLHKKSRYFKSLNKYIDKWGENDKIVRKQVGVWYRYFGVFTENGKWRRILANPVLFCGAHLLRLLVGLRYLIAKFSA